MALFDDLKPTGRTGVFYQEHDTRKHGATQKDRLLVLRYSIAGKRRIESFGWTSAGATEIDAEKKILDFKKNHKEGKRPTSLAEERAILDGQRTAEEEARQAAATAEEERRKEEARRNITFADYWRDHYLPARQDTTTTGTWKTERALFTHWIEPTLGKLRFKEIAPLHVRAIRKKLIDNGKSLATVRMAFCTIQQLWNMARADGYAAGDSPTKDGTAKMPTKKDMSNERERYLEREEAEALLKALRDKSPQMADMALLSLHTGMRAGEVFGLTWDCVDLDKRTLRLLDTKTRSPRSVPVTDTAAAMLTRRKESAKNAAEEMKVDASKLTDPERKAKLERKVELELTVVFPAVRGEKQSSVVSKTFARVVDDLGLNKGITDRRKRLVFHSLRHSAASFMVEAGVPIYTVSKILGHSSLDMTKRYAHLKDDGLLVAVASIDAALSAPPVQKKEEVAQ